MGGDGLSDCRLLTAKLCILNADYNFAEIPHTMNLIVEI